jgi:ceramide glucosyltransferase
MLTVAHADDPAWEVITAAASRLQQQGIEAEARIVPPRGPNHKAGQLAVVLDELLSPPVVAVVADADCDLSGLNLDQLVAPLTHDPSLGVLWVPPTEGAEPASLGDLASAAVLAGSFHSFPLLSVLDPRGAVGKLFAVPLSVVRRIGGWAQLGWYLGEDMELARRVLQQGLRVAASPQVVPSLARGRSLSDVARRFGRWVQVIRRQRPWLLLSYPLFFAPTAPLVVLTLGPLLRGGGWAWSLAAGALGLMVVNRLALAAAARRTAGWPWEWGLLWAPFVAELTLWAALSLALTQRRVRWAGRTLSFGGRRLVEGDEAV